MTLQLLGFLPYPHRSGSFSRRLGRTVRAGNCVASVAASVSTAKCSLVDHVHPSIRGHQLIADAIAEWLIAERLLQPDAGYDQRRAAAYQAHLASLDSFYFEEGRRRLEYLQDWARGRATIVRPTTGGGELAAPLVPKSGLQSAPPPTRKKQEVP